MAKEYIERGALLEELQEEIDFESAMYTEEQNKWLRAGLSIAARDVRNQPTADVVQRKEYVALMERYNALENDKMLIHDEGAMWHNKCKDLEIELDAMRGAANSFKMLYEDLKSENLDIINTLNNESKYVAKQILEEIEPIFMSSCLSLDAYTTWNRLKEKYTKGGEQE